MFIIEEDGIIRKIVVIREIIHINTMFGTIIYDIVQVGVVRTIGYSKGTPSIISVEGVILNTIIMAVSHGNPRPGVIVQSIIEYGIIIGIIQS